MKVLPGGDRLAVDKEGDLVIVDLPTGKVHVEPKTRLYAATPDYLFVGDDKVGRRERAVDFPLPGEGRRGGKARSHGMRGVDDFHVLAGGDTMAIGDSLVSFATGKVLARRLQFHAPRADGKRIAACDSATLSIVEVDAATGAIGARFPLREPYGVTECRSSDNPAYADDHTLFWFEMGEDTKDAGRKMVVCAGDTTTGKVTRFEEPSQTWSIGFASYPFVEDGRLCTTIASFHTSVPGLRLGPLRGEHRSERGQGQGALGPARRREHGCREIPLRGGGVHGRRAVRCRGRREDQGPVDRPYLRADRGRRGVGGGAEGDEGLPLSRGGRAAGASLRSRRRFRMRTAHVLVLLRAGCVMNRQLPIALPLSPPCSHVRSPATPR